MNHESLAEHINVTPCAFNIIKEEEIVTSDDKKLRIVRDKLGQEYTYNQIRFVLACLIHDLEL